MGPKYLTRNIGSPKAKGIVPQVPSSPKKTKLNRTQRRHLFCLLLLANIIVFNAGYGLATAEKDTLMWKAIATDNLIYTLWRKYPLISTSPRKGMVVGILFNETNPAALINNKLVHEGDTISDIKIVQITPRTIQFEKNGKMWAQGVQERPNKVW